jgi:hypothetical protein
MGILLFVEDPLIGPLAPAAGERVRVRGLFAGDASLVTTPSSAFGHLLPVFNLYSGGEEGTFLSPRIPAYAARTQIGKRRRISDFKFES